MSWLAVVGILLSIAFSAYHLSQLFRAVKSIGNMRSNFPQTAFRVFKSLCLVAVGFIVGLSIALTYVPSIASFSFDKGLVINAPGLKL